MSLSDPFKAQMFGIEGVGMVRWPQTTTLPAQTAVTLWRGQTIESLSREDLIRALHQAIAQNGELRAEIDRLHRGRQA